MSESPEKCSQCGAELPADSESSLCPRCLLNVGFATEPGPTATSSGSYQPDFIPPSPEELSPLFPQLEILEVVGHGGMGVVYKARQIELDRIVALKILRPNISRDPGFAERFQREARALAKLNHPNIITVFDFGRCDALFYFVMEYVDGTNLRHIERVGALQPSEALRIVPQVCSALQYAHDNGVVHRDIKPENILIAKDGSLRIADFGLAKLAGTVDNASLTGTWQVMGTPHYMAPEQFEKPASVDHRADIYSLGVVIYELLTGELPLGRFPLPSETAHVDVRLDEVVLRSLDKQPERRYQHVTDVATAVERASDTPADSRLAHAKDWMKAKAEAVSDGAKSFKDSLPDVRPRFGGWADSMARRHRGLGTALIIVGAADAIVSGIFCIDHPTRNADLLISLAFMSMLAGCLSFYMGRRLYAFSVSNRLCAVAAFSIMPWFGFLPLSILRAVLTGLACLASAGHHDTAGLSNQSEGLASPGPADDPVSRLLSGLWSLVSLQGLRLLSFTVLGIAGWIAVCVVSIGGAHELWFDHFISADYSIRDTSAQNALPESSAYERLRIEASGSGVTLGRHHHGQNLERDLMTLRIEDGPLLNVDLQTGVCWPSLGPEPLAEASEIDVNAVREWVVQSDVDVEQENVSQEILNLTEVLLVMQKTKGVADRLSVRDRETYPTLHDGITRVLQNDDLMRTNVIPVGWLLHPDSFRTDGSDSVWVSVRPQDWAEGFFITVAVILAAIGALRVLRILLWRLWLPCFRHRSANAAEWRRCWRRNCVALATFAALSGLVPIWAAWQLQLHPQLFTEYDVGIFAVSADLAWRVLLGLIAAVVAMVVCTLLARPLLKQFGWWSGIAAGVLGLILPPLALLTFPSGLAALVNLTAGPVRPLFGFPHQPSDFADPTTATAPAT